MSVNQPGYGSFVWTDPVGLTWLRLEAVIDPAEPAALWVADPSPRAQAFYRKHGFAADGTARSGDGVREIRMVRGVQHDGTGRSRRELQEEKRPDGLDDFALGPCSHIHQFAAARRQRSWPALPESLLRGRDAGIMEAQARAGPGQAGRPLRRARGL